MTINTQQFSLYTAKIFELLFESFPIPMPLDENEVISEYLLFNREDEIKKLKTTKDLAEIFLHLEDKDLNEAASKKLPKVEREIHDLEKSRTDEIANQKAIYNGTLAFLVSEHLIREVELGKYQLTSKSFTHLNKKFEDGVIDDVDGSYIAAFKSVLDKTSNISIDIALNRSADVLAKFLELS